ncbi:hypothetical protein BDV19DRAFT_261860 [Aspergillus venezuelensis]
MDAQDDISDFEFSDSEYPDIDELENTRDAFEKLSLKDPESLESKIAKAIPSSEAHLLGIRRAPNADDLFIWILPKVVEGGHTESYRLMIKEFLQQAELYYRRIRVRRTRESQLQDKAVDKSVFKFERAIREAFTMALRVKDIFIAHDIIDHVPNPRYGCENSLYWPCSWAVRKRTLFAFLEANHEYNDGSYEMMLHISKNNTEVNALSAKLCKMAIGNGELRFMRTLIHSILSAEISPGYMKELHLEEDGKITRRRVFMEPDLQKLKVIERPLVTALEMKNPKWQDAVRLLLPAYLTCMVRVYLNIPQSV